MLFVLFVSASVVAADDIVLRGGSCQAGTWGTPDTGDRLWGVSVFMTKGVSTGAKAWKVCEANPAFRQKSGCFAQKKKIDALESGVKGVTIRLVKRRVDGGPDHYEIDGATEAQLMSIFTGRWTCP
jgi:hypothetical protein